MNRRPVRIAGWLPVESGRGTAERPSIGGVVDVSRSGAKLYLTWRYRPGDRVPLSVRLPGESRPRSLPARVVWARQDEPGRVEALEARLKLLQELVRRGVRVAGMPYGFLYGVRFEPDVSPAAIRTVQEHLQAQENQPRKRVFLKELRTGSGGAPGSVSLRPDAGNY